MEPLFLEGKEDTPKIILNSQSNQYLISGRSLPEDATSFYSPVLKWLDEFSTQTVADPNVKFEVRLEYFNTASSKLLLDIFSKLEGLSENGKKVTVQWYYSEDDEDMLEAGEEYSELVDLKFEMKTY
ncbi:MAG: DUF1987 domain-containing protein [Bacteroidota bacterium]|nr:DUF1987 domain-containing protein [Bacteroidota bacterium]